MLQRAQVHTPAGLKMMLHLSRKQDQFPIPEAFLILKQDNTKYAYLSLSQNYALLDENSTSILQFIGSFIEESCVLTLHVEIIDLIEPGFNL